MSTCIKIRGIYATAPDQAHAGDSGYEISLTPPAKPESSSELDETVRDYEILIVDRNDFQGMH